MACSMFPLIILIPPLLKMFSTEPFEWFPRWISTWPSSSRAQLRSLAVWNLTAFFRQLHVELSRRRWWTAAFPGVRFRR